MSIRLVNGRVLYSAEGIRVVGPMESSVITVEHTPLVKKPNRQERRKKRKS